MMRSLNAARIRSPLSTSVPPPSSSQVLQAYLQAGKQAARQASDVLKRDKDSSMQAVQPVFMPTVITKVHSTCGISSCASCTTQAAEHPPAKGWVQAAHHSRLAARPWDLARVGDVDAKHLDGRHLHTSRLQGQMVSISGTCMCSECQPPTPCCANQGWQEKGCTETTTPTEQEVC